VASEGTRSGRTTEKTREKRGEPLFVKGNGREKCGELSWTGGGLKAKGGRRTRNGLRSETIHFRGLNDEERPLGKKKKRATAL